LLFATNEDKETTVLDSSIFKDFWNRRSYYSRWRIDIKSR